MEERAEIGSGRDQLLAFLQLALAGGRKTIQSTTSDSCSFNRVTEVADKFIVKR
jgi:hypothetical protein